MPTRVRAAGIRLSTGVRKRATFSELPGELEHIKAVLNLSDGEDIVTARGKLRLSDSCGVLLDGDK